METKVHHELSTFLSQHALEDCISNIDEIVLTYLVGVVELASQGDDSTDFEDVLDMMQAYLPGFEKIDRSEVVQWMFGLAEKLAKPTGEDNTLAESKDESSEDSKGGNPSLDAHIDNPRDTEEDEKLSQRQSSFPHYDYTNSESHSSSFLQTHNHSKVSSWKDCIEDKTLLPKDKPTMKESLKPPEVVNTIRVNAVHPNSRNREKKNHSKRKGRQLSCSSQESQEDQSHPSEEDLQNIELQIRALLEMFPSACTTEAHHCLRLSNGDLDQAAQLIMDRQESGEAIASGGSLDTKNSNQKAKASTKYKLDDDSIKLSVLQKYSFIDTEDDKRTYRPPPLKKEAKKMVRYRDGQVVSLKGERFSEIKKNTNEMKS